MATKRAPQHTTEQPAAQPAVAPTPISTARKARTLVPAGETKDQKLVRLANKRVSNALKYIRLIGNLGAYKPSEEQIDKIEQALGESSASVINRLRGTTKETFTFSLHK